VDPVFPEASTSRWLGAITHHVLHIQPKHQPPAELEPLPAQAVAAGCCILSLQPNTQTACWVAGARLSLAAVLGWLAGMIL